MKTILKGINEIYESMTTEVRIVFSDFGILLVALLAILIYGVIYSYSYSPQVLLDTPIAVVDMDHSPQSHRFVQYLKKSPNVSVCYDAPSLEDARKLFMENKVYGILYIGKGFEKDLASGQTAYFSIYADASYFLAYKQVFIASNEAMLAFNKEIKKGRLELAGIDSRKADFMSGPVNISSQFLYNRFQGYGSFLMPAVLVLILQQTILLAAGMVVGKIRERKLAAGLYRNASGRRFAAVNVVIGRSLFYTLANLVLWFLVLSFIYSVFSLPSNGNFAEIYALIVPYLLASSFLGIALSSFFRYKESSILFIFFTSIPFLLISGVSWPQQGMPQWMVWFSKAIPSTDAINGFVRLQTMGANLGQVAAEYYTLWGLAAVFFVFAVWRYRILLKQQ